MKEWISYVIWHRIQPLVYVQKERNPSSFVAKSVPCETCHCLNPTLHRRNLISYIQFLSLKIYLLATDNKIRKKPL